MLLSSIIVDIFFTSRRPEIGGMLVSSPDGLVGKEEVEEIMSVRERHVETSKEQVERAHCCYCCR